MPNELKMRVCALDGCEKKFTPGRTTQKFCSPPHAAQASNISRRGAGREGGREEGILERRMLSAQAAATVAKRTETALRSELELTRGELDAAQLELADFRRPGEATPAWLRPPAKKSKVHRGTLIAFLSDTHFGEVVEPDEVNGYNAYNLAIAEKRLQRFFERTIKVARTYLAGVEYDGVVLVHGGDIVSGDIHDELTQTNELSTLETCRWAVPRLKRGIEMFAEEFGRVHNVSVPGNHGRNTRKPRHKRRAANNADTHIAHLLADQLDDADITFHVPASIDAGFEVYDKFYSVEHGDQARGGDGQVGALGPVKRMTLRKATQTQEEGRAFDVALIGHFHQLVFGQTQGFVMNGSLKSYDEYARAWHFRPERAQQALMVATPEHGITVCAPVICQDRASEGW